MAGNEIEVRWAADPLEVQSALQVREEVFCVEQGVPREEEIDARDHEAEHVVALEPGGTGVIATARLLRDGERAKIGRVAVLRGFRGRGIASAMLELALARARELGCRQARLASQLQATALYERAGFTVESEPFDDAGIPHVWMGLVLGATPPPHPR